MTALEDLGGQAGGPPVITLDASGQLEVRWPLGRPQRVELACHVFEQLIDDANGGRRAVAVLAEVAAALTRLT